MVTKLQVKKAFDNYGRLHAKGMANIRKDKRLSGIMALDVSDSEIIKLGGLSASEKKLFLSSAKILEGV